MKIFKEVKKNLFNLKEYHILRFFISVLDHEKRKGMISYSIFFYFLNFLNFPLVFKN